MKLMNVISKSELKERILEYIKTLSRKTIDKADNDQIYEALVFAVRDIITDKWIDTHETYSDKDVKIVYYLSMEFLMGRFLGNAVINLTIDTEVREVLGELGINYNAIIDAELDAGLGSGGLGRLAACFLDSLSTLELPAYGCGIRYHHGIFEQRIENGNQVEYADNWLKNGDLWGVKRKEYALEIKIGGYVTTVPKANGKLGFTLQNYYSVMAVPYDYPIIGYGNDTVNTLRLWEAAPVHEFDLQSFNRGDYRKANEESVLANTLSEVLYPADDNIAGKELRLKQQYFFVSASLQRVVNRFMAKHIHEFDKLPDYAQFQMNDTHPSLAVAELMRILMDDYDIEWDDAWEITKNTCAYTNHTIMSEALEKWPIELFSRLLPRIHMIVEEINRRFCANLINRFGNNPGKIRDMAIIADGQIRMAYLAIVGSHSINGVAQIHSEILINNELKDFYDIYPEKFNNKTNGITQRRWLAYCNPGLSSLITAHIGNSWITDLSQLTKLEDLAFDEEFQEKFMQVKRENKRILAQYIKNTMNIDLDENSIFDIQVKRLHEYKRQLLNILHIIDLYNRIRMNPSIDIVPRTFIFSAKASASYRRAKLIIKLINSVAELVNNDPIVDGRIKIVFLANYRVSLAELLVPAADVSEQISTAGKEASGTGNMKFMLNGALTIGTLDGANVEMLEEVGKDNIFIFGLTAGEIAEMVRTNSYAPWDVYNMNYNLRMVLTELINGTLSPENHDLFREIYDMLLNGYEGSKPDEYFILKDYAAYGEAQQKVNDAYKDKSRWVASAILNVARSGKFSSDRTIKQYADEIWKLKPVHIGNR